MLEETLSSEDTGMDLSICFNHYKENEIKENYEKKDLNLYFPNFLNYSPDNVDYMFMIKKIEEISNKRA
jgi:hypothetical protein